MQSLLFTGCGCSCPRCMKFTAQQSVSNCSRERITFRNVSSLHSDTRQNASLLHERLTAKYCIQRSEEFVILPRLTQMLSVFTRRPESADRTARRQFQAVFPVITGSFPANVIAHLHGLSMDLTVGGTVGPTVDSTVGRTVGLTVKLCKHWFDSRSNY